MFIKKDIAKTIFRKRTFIFNSTYIQQFIDGIRLFKTAHVFAISEIRQS